MTEEFCPYPGLRPFKFSDAQNFFGRDEIIQDVVQKLEKQGSVYLIGPSGSGKSSLAFAGVIPALHRGGFLSNARRWRVAVFRPSGGPIKNLAASIFDSFYNLQNEKHSQGANAGNIQLSSSDIDQERRQFISLATSNNQEEFFEKVSDLFYSKELVDKDGEPQENLLIIADQFEELFRATHFYKQPSQTDADYLSDRRSKIQQFVELFLGLRDECGGRVYLFTTMRTDFLVDCEISSILQRDIDRYDYSIRKLSKDECREVILAPARQNAVSIKTKNEELEDAESLSQDVKKYRDYILNSFDDGTHPLIETLLLEMEKETAEYLKSGGTKLPDQLPLLQHALCQIWFHRYSDGDATDMGLRDYYSYINNEGNLNAVVHDSTTLTGLSQSLNNHLDDIYSKLSNEDKKITKQIFLSLVNIMEGSRWTSRRRLPVKKLLNEVKLQDGKAQLIRILDAFRTPAGRFLTTDKNLRTTASLNDIWIDISHESLLRHWKKLSIWISHEIRDLTLANDYFRRDKLYGADLREAILWRERKEKADTFDVEWFKRHENSLTMNFSSEEERGDFKKVKPAEVYNNILETFKVSEKALFRQRKIKKRRSLERVLIAAGGVFLASVIYIKNIQIEHQEVINTLNDSRDDELIEEKSALAENINAAGSAYKRENARLQEEIKALKKIETEHVILPENIGITSEVGVQSNDNSSDNISISSGHCEGYIWGGSDTDPKVKPLEGQNISQIVSGSKLKALTTLKIRDNVDILPVTYGNNYIAGKWIGTVINHVYVDAIGEPEPYWNKNRTDKNYWIKVAAPLKSCFPVYIQYSTDKEFYLAQHTRRALRDIYGFDVGPVEKVPEWNGYTKTKYHTGSPEMHRVSKELNNSLNNIFEDFLKQPNLSNVQKEHFQSKIPNEPIPDTFEYSNNVEIWIGRLPEEAEVHWTPWYNRDTPGGVGDIEVINQDGSYCLTPLEIQCRVADSSELEVSKEICREEFGVKCNNTEDSTCFDYEIRLQCLGYRYPE